MREEETGYVDSITMLHDIPQEKPFNSLRNLINAMDDFSLSINTTSNILRNYYGNFVTYNREDFIMFDTPITVTNEDTINFTFTYDV